MGKDKRNIVQGDIVKYFNDSGEVIKAEVIDDYYDAEHKAVHKFILKELHTNREIIGSEIIKKVKGPMRKALTRHKNTRHRLANMGLVITGKVSKDE